MSSAINVYEVRINSNKTSKERLDEFFDRLAKKWCYQEEKGEDGYLHFQGRINLKVAERKTTLWEKFAKASMDSVELRPTASVNRTNDFYVTKPDTRVRGPWMDTDPKPCWDVDCFPGKLPWHDSCIAISQWLNRRAVYCLPSEVGNNGKTWWVKMCLMKKIAQFIPPVNDSVKLMGFVMKNQPFSKVYTFDIPRGMAAKKLQEMYIAIEQIKNGMAHDWRYDSQIKCFPAPVVWVFSNERPDLKYLTADRWKFFQLIDDELYLEDAGGLIHASQITQQDLGAWVPAAPPPDVGPSALSPPTPAAPQGALGPAGQNLSHE